MFRFSDEVVWSNFRFGSKPGAPFADSQFPVSAVGELSKQSVPDVSAPFPAANPTLKALSDLASQLKGAVVMSHSQSGSFPLEVALIAPTATRALVLVEPGRCPAYTVEQVARLATVPTLIVFGDHRETPTGLPTFPTWQQRFEACEVLIGRLKAAGGDAQMLNPPERGIRGNSHMIMQDKNHLQIADLILQWMEARVGTRGGGNKVQSRTPSPGPWSRPHHGSLSGVAAVDDEFRAGDELGLVGRQVHDAPGDVVRITRRL
jgi:hypothetical protein